MLRNVNVQDFLRQNKHSLLQRPVAIIAKFIESNVHRLEEPMIGEDVFQAHRNIMSYFLTSVPGLSYRTSELPNIEYTEDKSKF